MSLVNSTGYEWKNEGKGKQGGEGLVKRPNGELVPRILPRGLCHLFAMMTPSPQCIVNFANQFGFLLSNPVFILSKEQASKALRSPDYIEGESDWCISLLDMRRAGQLWNAINGRGTVAKQLLDSRIKVNWGKRIAHYVDTENTIQRLYEEVYGDELEEKRPYKEIIFGDERHPFPDDFNSTDNKQFARALLLRWVNDGLMYASLKPELTWRGKRKYGYTQISYNFEGALGEMWFQLAQEIAYPFQRAEVNCVVCGAPIDNAKRSTRIYCDRPGCRKKAQRARKASGG
ncbi:MAG: hypothetical protein ACYC7E_18150 [Armatimonadota bacterium]